MGNHEEGAKHASTADAFRGPTLSADYGQWRQLKLDEPRVMAAGECSPRNRGREVDLVWTNCRSRTRVEAVRGIGRRWSADVDCGRAWSAETSQRGWVLTGQTAEHRRGLEPFAVDAKTISPICLSGQTRICRVDPVRVLSLYKYFLDLILGLISYYLSNQRLFF